MAWKPGGRSGSRPKTPRDNRELPPKGRQQHEPITPEKFLEMIGLRAQGWTYQEMHVKYQIPITTIQYNFKTRDKEIMRLLKASTEQEIIRQLDACDRAQKRIWEQLDAKDQMPADTCRLVNANRGVLEDVRKLRGIGEYKDPRAKPDLPGKIDLDFDAADAGGEDDDGEAEDQADAQAIDRAPTPLLDLVGSVQSDDRGNRERQEQSGVGGGVPAAVAQHGDDCGPIVEDAATVNP